MKLKGRKALITGGASGIGAAITMLFAKEGADIAVNYRTRRETAEKMCATSREECGVRAMAVKADVSDPDQVWSMVDTVIGEWGSIDILVCSNGINRQTPFVEMTIEQWDEMINASLRSIFLCNRAVLPHMLERGFGRIINVTSQVGQIGGTECAHYGAAKAGVIGLTKCIAKEVSAHGVTANCIAPGPVANPFFFDNTSKQWQDDKLKSLPLGRFGEEYEVAPTALLLACEPDGNIYTGQTLGPNCGDVML